MNVRTLLKTKRAVAAQLALLILLVFAAAVYADSWTPDTRWYDDYKNERGTKEKPFLISTPE